MEPMTTFSVLSSGAFWRLRILMGSPPLKQWSTLCWSTLTPILIFLSHLGGDGDSPCGSVVKNLPAKQEMWVWLLGWEDPLKKEMATHSSILTGEIPWTEEPGRLQFLGSQRVRYDWVTNATWTTNTTWTIHNECFINYLEDRRSSRICNGLAASGS